jgi:hypothetical protein
MYEKLSAVGIKFHDECSGAYSVRLFSQYRVKPDRGCLSAIHHFFP